ncbi:MAG: ABC transporter permease [Clostridia bacterium]|jgi:ABC-2 type transport system permease protein|nr:ABC transporter permease [Clostridiaceae bacterium]
MNTLNIIIKELKQLVRDKKSNAIMILLPIVLIFILSKAFSGNFGQTLKLGDVSVLYTMNAEESLEQSFEMFMETINKELGIQFVEASKKKEGLKAVKDVKYACYIMIEENEIEIYKNERYNFSANLVESMVRSFAKRYDALNEIAKSNPQAIEAILSDETMNFTEIKSLDGKRSPSSLDYYAVTMLTLFLLYSSLTGYSSIKSEQYLRTQYRIFASPVKKHEYLTGKIIGDLSISLLQAMCVFIFGKYLLNANWGSDIPTVLLVVLAECIMTVSLGACTAVLFQKGETGIAVINIAIPVMAFLGGGYVPLSQTGDAINKLSVISPLKWTNEAIFKVIYNNDYSSVPIAIGISIGIAAIAIMLTAIKTGKEKSI